MNKNSIESIYPLSPPQQGMLFKTLSAGSSGFYVEQLSCTFEGNLNKTALIQAWQQVVDRHAVLRTAFVWKTQDQPKQVVLKQVAITLNHQDWRELAAAEQQLQLSQYLQSDRQQGFDLAKPPLMRFALLQLSDTNYQFVWTHHHILIDGWCLSILFQEFLSFYQAINKGEQLHLSPSRPYKDYIAWLKKQDLVQAEKFWRQTLQDFTNPTALGLPAELKDSSLPIITGYGKQEALLPATVTAGLQSLARKHRITFNTLIQGVWTLLLSHYSQITDVLFGITVSGRPADLLGSESMVGLFINTLPLRIKVNNQASLWSWLQEIYAYNLELRQYEYTPVGQIYQWSEVPGGVPLYESLLVFENYPINHSMLKSTDFGLRIANIRAEGAQTQYALTIVVNLATECKFSLIFDRSRFAQEDINLILQHLFTLLQSIFDHPQLDLATIKEKIPGKQIPRIKPRLKIEQQNPVTSQLTPVEEILSNIWTRILGLENLSIHDHFFDLGGHSLLATQVMSQIRETFQLELTLGDLFTAPTVADLAQKIELAQKTESTQKVPPLQPTARDGKLPLSFAQERLWFLEQLNPGSATYNELFAVKLTGSLHIAALEQSLNEIVRRHEALRTTFDAVDGEPFQAIAANLTIKLSIVDLRELPSAQQQTEVQRLATEEYQRTFNLTQGPLLRCTLLQLSKEDHIVFFTIHHIISDGWSMGVFVKELAALYTAFCTGKPSPLPELPIQYADFAIWQRQHLQAEILPNQLAYWEQKLGYNLPVLQLPTVQPRAEVKTQRGTTQTLIIPPDLSVALKALSRQEGVTLFMTLLAAFQILLQRYTNQDDIVVGTDVANRNRAEIEPLIGFFVNLLVLRTDLSGNPTFQELLTRVRQVALEAYAHQDLPFDQLVKALRPERNLSNTSPLFQVLFVLQNAPMPALELPGLTLNLLELERTIARFDLSLFFRESEQGILGKWQYNADLFTSATINQITANFQNLLNSIVSQPDARISNLEMLNPEKKQQQALRKQQRQAFKREKFLSFKPQTVSLAAENLIKTEYFQPEQNFPLVIQPNNPEIDLISWAKYNVEYLETELLKHGAILFRGFNIKSASEFENFAQTICPYLFAEYGDLPRTGEGGKVYGSTPYPADKAILFHNESSHLHSFPLKIWFYCVQPAAEGGETPIIDCRQAYKLLSPELREKLAVKQLMYVRNYAEGLDVSWQNFFQTTDKKEVENYCHQAGIEFEWYNNNGLVTRQIRPALAVHPKTGESVFFNQIQLHHISYLDTEVRQSLLSVFGESKLPRNVYFGDGTPITDTEIAEINRVYQQSQTSFPWQKGDIIMLDNMLAAHGRNPYVGQRKIVVAMGEMMNSIDLIVKN